MKSALRFLVFWMAVACPLFSQSIPVLQEIVPNSARVGSPAVAVTATGSGFTSTSVVSVNGEALPTTFVNSTTLRTTIPDNRLTTSNALSIQVANQGTSGISQAVIFSVYSAVPPSVTSINPVAGFRGATFTLTVTGSNLIGAQPGFSGTGISAVPQAGTTTRLPVQVSVAPEAPLGSQSVTISTPAGSTTTCGNRPCSFAIVDSGSWAPAGPFHDVRLDAAIVRLLDGRVLVAGGTSGISGSMTASAELFDPATGQWTPTGSMSLARIRAVASLLPDGRVLVAGGHNDNNLSSAEIYDPASGTWSVTGFMASQGAWGALLLSNGQVLIPHFSGPDEVFDPVAGRFTFAPGGLSSTDGKFASLLTDGRVLLLSDSGTNNKIYDPASGSLSSAPSVDPYTTAGARLLPDGRVLIRSMYSFAGTSGGTLINRAYLFNVATNTIVPASPDIDGPDALLPSGLIFIGGGVNSQAVNQKPILYDPSTDQIIAVPAMDKPFDLASSVLLNDGRVLVIGRDRTNSGSGSAVFSEIYSPPASNNPTPILTSVTSSNPASDSDVITLDIRGNSFLSNSAVNVGSTRLVTVYLGARRIVAFVPPSLRAALTSSGVTVTNPAPAGGTTDPVRVGFVAPPPVITSISPNAAVPGSQFTAIVSGQNIGDPTSVTFTGTGVTGTIQPGGSSTTLILSVQVAAGAGLGSRSLTIVTPSGSVTLNGALRIQSASAPATAPMPITEVETGAIRNGYAVITPLSGSVAPVSTLTYGMVRDGAVQSHGSILPTPLTTETSFLVDVVQTISRNLGIAIANSSGTAASIVMTLRDDDGTQAGAPVTLTIQGRQQLARFVTELFPSSAIGAAFRGNVTIQSSIPVSIVGIHFSGIEFSTVPVPVTGAPLSATSPVIFPQFAMSGGWATTLSLLNTSSGAISGRVDILDTNGNPMIVTLNGTASSTFSYSIPARGSMTLAPRDANGQSPF